MRNLEPGRIVAEDVGRYFELSVTGGRSLRGRLLGYEKHVPTERFWAVRNVDLDIQPGESFAFVGRNGSGKSTLLKMLARIFGPSEGRCAVGGRLSSLLELGAGFHQEFNAIENIYLAAAIYGIPRTEIHRERDAIIEFAELEKFAYQPIKTFSSGMFARLGFSVAMHVRPDVLLLDEVLAVGDEAFVQKCMGRIAEYRREGGTMILVTHNPAAVEQMCQRALLLERGTPIMTGPSHEVITTYHDRLASEQRERPGREEDGLIADGIRCSAVVADLAGSQRERFTEGEPFAIRIDFESDHALQPCRLTVALRDEMDRELGSTWREGFTLAKREPRSVTIRFEAPPLRAGLFPIDVHLQDAETTETFFEARAITALSILGQEADRSGPVAMNATWDAPTP